MSDAVSGDERSSPVAGTVVRWNDEEGWGVLASPEVDGAVFAHYSMIRDQTGWRGLRKGQQVWFGWDPSPQDGCPNRALDVYTTPELRTASAPGPNEAGTDRAFHSTLVINYDDSDDKRP